MTDLPAWVCPTCHEWMPVDRMPHRGCAGWSEVIHRRDKQDHRQHHGEEHRSEHHNK